MKLDEIADQLMEQFKLQGENSGEESEFNLASSYVDVIGSRIVVNYQKKNNAFLEGCLTNDEAVAYLSALKNGYRDVHMNCPEVYCSESMQKKLAKAETLSLSATDVSLLVREFKLKIQPTYERIVTVKRKNIISGYVVYKGFERVSTGKTRLEAAMKATCYLLKERANNVAERQKLIQNIQDADDFLPGQ